MRAELLSAVVQPSNAAVFAHLSPEESPAAWHFGPVGGRSDPSQVAPAATAALSAGFAAAFRREFRPEFFELVADAELQGHRRWAGELLGSVRAQSALYFRWLLLHDAVERREAAAARRFAYVLRLRPDILPGCALRPPSVAQLLEPDLDAVALSDQLVLLRRGAPCASRFARTSPLRRRRTAASRRSSASTPSSSWQTSRSRAPGREAPRSCAASRCVNRCSAEASSAGRASTTTSPAPDCGATRFSAGGPPWTPARRGPCRSARDLCSAPDGRASATRRRKYARGRRCAARCCATRGGGSRRVAARGLGESRSRYRASTRRRLRGYAECSR